MTDMSEGPNVSDERQHAEAVAREWFGANYSAWPELSAHFADLIMAERAGLLARAEAAEAACQQAYGCHHSWVNDVTDLRAQLAAAEASIKKSVECDWQVEAARLFEERGEERARAAKAEAAAGQMRAALEKHAGCHTVHMNSPVGYTCIDIRDDAKSHPERYSEEFGRIVGAGERMCLRCQATVLLAATDAGRGYQSPEQVAQACAAARDAALEDAAEDARMHFVMGHAIALRIRALKAGTP